MRLVVVPLASHTRERERAGATELDGSHGFGADANAGAVHNARHLVELRGTRGVSTRRLEDFCLRSTPLRLQERARCGGHEQRNNEDRPRSHGAFALELQWAGVRARLTFSQDGIGVGVTAANNVSNEVDASLASHCRCYCG